MHCYHCSGCFQLSGAVKLARAILHGQKVLCGIRSSIFPLNPQTMKLFSNNGVVFFSVCFIMHMKIDRYWPIFYLLFSTFASSQKWRESTNAIFSPHSSSFINSDKVQCYFSGSTFWCDSRLHATNKLPSSGRRLLFFVVKT